MIMSGLQELHYGSVLMVRNWSTTKYSEQKAGAVC